MGVERCFLAPEIPLPSSAVEFLAREWTSGHLDLREWLVVVSSRQAGRRLREGLAALAAGRGAAVFPPLVVTPEFLLTFGEQGGRVATSPDTLLAWTEVLRGIDFSSFGALFPAPPRRPDFSWALATGRELARVKRLLAEGGLGMRDVETRAPDGFGENERWRALAELERRYREMLKTHGLTDPDEAKIARAANPVTPDSVKRIVLLAVPDPLPLAVEALQKLSETLPVVVAIHADAKDRDAFDGWGRPVAEVWEQRVEDWDSGEDMFFPCSDAAAQARTAGLLLSECQDPARSAALGAADPTVIPFLDRSLPRDCDLEAYDPEGRPVKAEELYNLLACFRDLLRVRDYGSCGELIRCPVVIRYFDRLSGLPPFPAWLRIWEEFGADHLPGDLAAARGLAHAEARRNVAVLRIHEAVEEMLGQLDRAPVWEALPSVLRTLHGDRSFREDAPADRRYLATAEAMIGVLEELRDSPLTAEQGAVGGDGLDLLLGLLGDKHIEEDRPETAIDVQGWLELPWEEAPFLVLTGMNEHHVPETIAGDPFVPESLRRPLGLKSNRMRFARDRYLLESLIKCRREKGKVAILFGRFGPEGEPMRPSRLLMRCSREELPQRVKHLFADPPAVDRRSAWSHPWRLRPGRAAAPERISVTQFGAYLRCPFRFYLSNLLRMEPVDPRKTEMDAAEFGSACHRILEAFGRDEELRRSQDAAKIRAFFDGELDRFFHVRYGRDLPVPLVIQKEAISGRLARFAEVQAEERRRGWIIEEVEWQFPDDNTLCIGGLPVRGVIDRIERNETDGAYRVLDYKTADQDREPEKDHFVEIKKDEDAEGVPEYARFELDGKAHRWIGLQLPLYLWALRGRCGEKTVCGYVNLPKAVTETGISLWRNRSRELEESAHRCAEGVVADLRAGVFWPPAAKVTFDDFKELFFGDIEGLTDPSDLRFQNFES